MNSKLSFESLCVHEGENKLTTQPQQQALYLSSSFKFENIDEGIDIFTGKKEGHVYGRYGNPGIDSIAQKIADMEAYGLDFKAWGLMCSSGMSAIATLVMSLVQSGDTILTQGNLYGGTTELFKSVLSKSGITSKFTNLLDLENVEHQLKSDKQIKVIYLETPTNPTVSCIDLAEIGALAKKYNVLTIVDNTFCTPYLQQPFKYGIDYIIHSTTKFLNGHGNSISGIIIGKDDELKDDIWKTLKLIGTNCSPFEAWLLNTGVKTLKLRMDKHCQNAQTIAEYLENHARVAKVNYCGLASHESHQIAKTQMNDYGAMMSFEVEGGLQAGIDFMNKIKFCSLAPTLGDIDTLILHPASMSHLNVDREIRMRNGISDGLIRLSVGIEDVQDIIGDLGNALIS